MLRLLVSGIFWNGFRGQSILEWDNGILTIEPFVRERQSTIFLPGYIAVIDAGKFDEFVLDDIELMIAPDGMVADKKKLDDYLMSSSLYFSYNGNGAQPLFLRLGRPCQIIPTS